MRGSRQIISKLALLVCGLQLMGMPLQTSVPAASPITQTGTAKVFAYPQPPRRFDPLAASDADLAKYGFPPRPDSRTAPALYDQWKRMVSVPRGGKPIMRSTKIYNGTAQQARPGAEP